MSKPDAPAAPDYVGAANAEGQSSLQTTIANALLNRPNQYSPYGSQTWTQTGSTTIPGTGTAGTPATEGHWVDGPAGGNSGGVTYAPGGAISGGGSGTSRVWVPGTAGTPGTPGTAATQIPQFSSQIKLSPEGQQLFDKDTLIKLGLMDAGQGSLNQVKNSLSTPFDLSSLPSDYNQKVADAMYGKATANLDPQWAQAEDKERNRLINAGFSVGNEGFTTALDNFQRQKEGAYGDARDRSILTGAQQGQQDRQQAIQEMLLQRTQPLTELNALRTGAAPQMPSFPSGNVGANSQPANLLGATQAQGQASNDIYNADVGTYNSTLQTAGGLGAAALAAYFF